MREITTESELDDILKKAGDKVVAVYFSATWCGPCKIVGPVYDKLSKDSNYKSTFIFTKCDVDEIEDDLTDSAGIDCMPTIAFYRNGEQFDKMSGANKSKLEQKVKELQQKQQEGK